MGTLGKSVSHEPAIGLAEGAGLDLSHLEYPFRPTNVFLIIALVVLGTVALSLHYTVYGEGFSDRALSTYCWLYAVVTLLWLLAKALRPAPHNWLSPDVVFWLVYTMFHIPYIVFYLMGLAAYTRLVFHATEATNRAMVCVLLCGMGFLMGYELGALGRGQPARFAVVGRIPASVFLGAQLLFAATGVAAAFALGAGLGSAILTVGYEGFRHSERYLGPEAERWVSLSVIGLRIGVTVYVASCILRYRKIIHGVILPVCLGLVLLFFLLLGARSVAAVVALPAVLGYHYFMKPIRLRWGIPALLGALVLFGMVGIGRKAESLSPQDIYQAYKDYLAQTGVNPFVASLAEAGASYKTVNLACAYIPNVERYWRGRSLVDSALMIVPSPIAGLRSDLTPSTWATLMATGEMGRERAGWGSSIAMEAYMNFGLLGGAAFLVVVGYAMRRIYDTTLRRPGFLRVCFFLITVTSLALWCRNYSHHFFRPTAWTMACAWLVWSVFGGGRTRAVDAHTPTRRLAQ